MATKTAFAREAEEIAEGVREELNLSNLVALEPFSLLQFLGIPAISLMNLLQLSGDDSELAAAIDLLHQESSLSAMTVFRGNSRMIVYSDAHTQGRRNSDLCHEAAHALLLHPPAPAFDANGCRSWNGDIEEQAQFLAGTLLIPGKGARYAAKAGWSHEYMAQRFGCSVDLARWRDNTSGGVRLRRRGASFSR